MRLTPQQKADIERLAHQQDTTQKEAILEAVRETLKPERPEEKIRPKPGSFMERIEHLAGCIDDPKAPTDLSTNKKYLEDLGQSSMPPGWKP